MADAWKVVRSAGEGAFPYDSAWRLLEGSDPVSLARGRSASGAAAWGWWFLLNDKIPDAQIIVVAQVTSEGRFGEVERHGIECKARAIAKSGRFDRVLVVGEENRSEFLKVFKKIGGRVPSIDVVNLDGSDSCVLDHARGRRLGGDDAPCEH